MAPITTHLAVLDHPPLSVPLATVKHFLRVEHDEDDGHLQDLIHAATQNLEQFCNTIWLPRPLLWTLAAQGASPGIAGGKLRMWALGRWRETSPGIAFALPTPTLTPQEHTCTLTWGNGQSGEFEMIPAGTPATPQLHLSSEAWGGHLRDLPKAEGVQLTLRIQYQGGSVASATALPADIRHAICLLVADYYDRGTQGVEVAPTHPAYVLVAPYRHFSL